MRLALQMRTGLERETLPSDNRRACLSLIKRATTGYADGKYLKSFIKEIIQRHLALLWDCRGAFGLREIQFFSRSRSHRLR